MNDNQGDRPLPKATPRNNYKLQVLDNITVNLERLNVGIDKSEQKSGKVVYEKEVIIGRDKQTEIIDRKEGELINQVENKQSGRIQKQVKEKISKQKVNDIDTRQRDDQNNKQGNKRVKQKTVVSLPQIDNQQQQQQEIVIMEHSSRQLPAQMMEQVEVIGNKNRKKLLIEMGNCDNVNNESNIDGVVNKEDLQSSQSQSIENKYQKQQQQGQQQQQKSDTDNQQNQQQQKQQQQQEVFIKDKNEQKKQQKRQTYHENGDNHIVIENNTDNNIQLIKKSNQLIKNHNQIQQKEYSSNHRDYQEKQQSQHKIKQSINNRQQQLKNNVHNNKQKHYQTNKVVNDQKQQKTKQQQQKLLQREQEYKMNQQSKQNVQQKISLIRHSPKSQRQNLIQQKNTINLIKNEINTNNNRDKNINKNKDTISQPQPQFPTTNVVNKIDNKINNQKKNHYNHQSHCLNKNYHQQDHQLYRKGQLQQHQHQKQQQQQQYHQHHQKQKQQQKQQQQQQYLDQKHHNNRNGDLNGNQFTSEQLQHQHYHYQQQKQQYQQQQQQQQLLPQMSFDIQTYKDIQPLLQDLLIILKNSLKVVKQQHSKAKLNYFNTNNKNDNNNNNTNTQLILPSNNNNKDSRFFNNNKPKISRSESRNNNSKWNSNNNNNNNNNNNISRLNQSISKNNNSLMDIIQRRRIMKQQKQEQLNMSNKNRPNLTQYNNNYYKQQQLHPHNSTTYGYGNMKLKQQRINMFNNHGSNNIGRSKNIALGLGSGIGNIPGGMTEYGFAKYNNKNNTNNNNLNYSNNLQQTRYNNNFNRQQSYNNNFNRQQQYNNNFNQQQQLQQQDKKINQNRNKINQILASSSVGEGFKNNSKINNQKQKKPYLIPQQQKLAYKKQKISSFFSQQQQQYQQLPQGVIQRKDKNHYYNKNNNIRDSSFFYNNNNQLQQQLITTNTNNTKIFNSRKIIKSSNHLNSNTQNTTQKATIQRKDNLNQHQYQINQNKPQRSSSFFRNSRSIKIGQIEKQQKDKQQIFTLTPILKVIKKYLQIIAQGKIDNIQTIISHNSLTNNNVNLNTSTQYHNIISSTNSINDLIARKKLFKLAMYYQRAAIVAGICYGYLMITQQRGLFRYQVQQLNNLRGNFNLSLNGKNKQRSFSTHANNNMNIQMGNNNNNTLIKQQTKLILKYMINLVSFSLNNSKLITKTLQTYYLKKEITLNNDKPTQRSFQQKQLNNNSNKNNSTIPDKKNNKQFTQQILIQKQIYKRNTQTIKLNIQYTQQTLQKLFTQTYQLSKVYNIDQDFGQSFKNVTKIVNKNSIQQSFYTLLQYFSYYLSLAKRQRSIPFLAVAPNPYLDPSQRYTLVIDFISVFCHGTKRSKTFIFRPYSQHFLYEMSQYFDIVVISDALPQQIDKIIDILDPKNIIQHRLYKYHMVEERQSGKFIKNLQRLGRDMNKTLLLDVEENRCLSQQHQVISNKNNKNKNTIFINQWRGSKHDTTLAELCSVLISIVMENLDCDKAAKIIDRQMKMNKQKGIKFINFGLNLKEEVQNQQFSYNDARQNNGNLDEDDKMLLLLRQQQENK